MNKEEYNRLFDLGVEFRDEGTKLKEAGEALASDLKFHKAIKIFEELFPIEIQADKFNKCLLLGSLYNWTGDKKKAFDMFKMGLSLEPDSELASLCLYLIYIDLDNSEGAIEELTRFLNLHPAKLYKDTLHELMEEINNGRLPLYKKRIVDLAEKNGIYLEM